MELERFRSIVIGLGKLRNHRWLDSSETCCAFDHEEIGLFTEFQVLRVKTFCDRGIGTYGRCDVDCLKGNSQYFELPNLNKCINYGA